LGYASHYEDDTDWGRRDFSTLDRPMRTIELRPAVTRQATQGKRERWMEIRAYRVYPWQGPPIIAELLVDPDWHPSLVRDLEWNLEEECNARFSIRLGVIGYLNAKGQRATRTEYLRDHGGLATKCSKHGVAVQLCAMCSRASAKYASRYRCRYAA